jgi:hypothetical protein
LGTVISAVAIVASASAIGFVTFLPFSTVTPSAKSVSCRPPVFEVFRLRISNPDYGYDDGLAHRSLREAVGQLGPTFRNVCQAPSQGRVVIAAGVLLLSFVAVTLVRKLESNDEHHLSR